MFLEEKLNSGRFIVLSEFDPPKGSDFSHLSQNANLVKGRVDALVVPEMGNAVMKASSLGTCSFLERAGFSTVFQLCCRDRNRLALQADILAASALGIRNVMAVSGEEIRFGDHPQARSVHDIDLLELLAVLEQMKNGRDMAGIELKGSPGFLTGSSVNAGAMGGALDIEIENMEKMVERGVRFIITSPIFDLHAFRQFMRRVEHLQAAVIPTVLLLKSAGMARYIDRNIRNISVPQEMIRGIQKAPDKLKECIRIASNLIADLREMEMAGIMVSTMGWEDKLPMVLDRANL